MHTAPSNEPLHHHPHVQRLLPALCVSSANCLTSWLLLLPSQGTSMYWPHPGGIVTKTIVPGKRTGDYPVPAQSYLDFTKAYAADLEPVQNMILAIEAAAKKAGAVAVAAAAADAKSNSTAKGSRLILGPAAAVLDASSTATKAVVASSIKAGTSLDAQLLTGYMDPLNPSQLIVYAVEVSCPWPACSLCLPGAQHKPCLTSA
jgi:hypothetical protein